MARAQGLQGKALRYYNGALTIEPTDMAALGGTVRALVERGAIVTAKENLARMKTLCRGACPQTAELDALIARGAPAQAAVTAKDVAPPKALAGQP